jgi:hypothetical protein
VLVSGLPRAVSKAARLARDGLKKSQTLIVFGLVDRGFKKERARAGQDREGRFGRLLTGPQANT